MTALLITFLIAYLIIATITAALVAYTQHLHHRTLIATTRVLYNPENPGSNTNGSHWTAVQ